MEYSSPEQRKIYLHSAILQLAHAVSAVASFEMEEVREALLELWGGDCGDDVDFQIVGSTIMRATFSRNDEVESIYEEVRAWKPSATVIDK